MASVTFNKLYKRYGKVEIVHGIDLEIADNEFIVLVGPSGCGKSTCLRMIAGLEDISEGTIKIDDTVVNDIEPKDRNLAMVFQNYALYPHMTVFDNMGFSLRLEKKPKKDIEEAVNGAAKILGLENLLHRKPSELSGGQRQRVAMGRAIVRYPKVFLFDEPLSNLDAQLRTQMRMEIKKLHMKLRTTTVYVTHDQVEAMTLADRIVIMKDGYIMQVGSPMDVYNKPANKFVATFIGNPPMNILEATLKRSSNGFSVVSKALEIPVPDRDGHKLKEGKNVMVGIRPNHILMAHDDLDMPESWMFNGQILVSETLGGESLLNFSLDGVELLAQVEGAVLPKIGSFIKFAFNLNHLHIFDQVTEETIY